MDFVILTVNGVDVSSCSHEEAVQRFLEAKEPIMVQVRRRGEVHSSSSSLLPSSPTPGERGEEEQDSSGRESEEALIYPDFEYEEIGLVRASPCERLGLTLCYEDEDREGNTEIFIDDIAPEGLAARDGRLRLGDQIVAIQGLRVRSKAAAQEAFTTIQGNVTLLVARPPRQGGDYEEDLDHLLDLSEEVATRGRAEDRKDVSSHRLSSTSSKDSGHTSGTIDRSTTASSNSTSSKASEEEGRRRGEEEEGRRRVEEEVRRKSEG